MYSILATMAAQSSDPNNVSVRLVGRTEAGISRFREDQREWQSMLDSHVSKRTADERASHWESFNDTLRSWGRPDASTGGWGAKDVAIWIALEAETHNFGSSAANSRLSTISTKMKMLRPDEPNRLLEPCGKRKLVIKKTMEHIALSYGTRTNRLAMTPAMLSAVKTSGGMGAESLLALEMLYMTGCRANEILTIRAEHGWADTSSMCFKFVHKTKTSRGAMLTFTVTNVGGLAARAAAHLMAARAAGHELMFQELTQYGLRRDLRLAIARACPGADPARYGLHSTRSGSVSTLVANGGSQRNALSLGRWASLGTVKTSYLACHEHIDTENQAILSRAVSLGGLSPRPGFDRTGASRAGFRTPVQRMTSEQPLGTPAHNSHV